MTDANYPKDDARPLFEDERAMPVVVHALHLLGFVTGGLTAVAAVILAYVGLNEDDWRRTHYLHAIYTFWLTLAAFVVVGVVMTVLLTLGVLLTMTVIGAIVGVPLLILAGIGFGVPAVYFAVRSILALLYALRGEAYPRPRSWLL